MAFHVRGEKHEDIKRAVDVDSWASLMLYFSKLLFLF